jgi:hypothetical protein
MVKRESAHFQQGIRNAHFNTRNVSGKESVGASNTPMFCHHTHRLVAHLYRSLARVGSAYDLPLLLFAQVPLANRPQAKGEVSYSLEVIYLPFSISTLFTALLHYVARSIRGVVVELFGAHVSPQIL